MANDTAVDLTDIGFVPVTKPAAAVKSVDLSDIGFVPVKKSEAGGPQEFFPAEGEAGKPSKGERDPRTGLPMERDFSGIPNRLRKTKAMILQAGGAGAGAIAGSPLGPPGIVGGAIIGGLTGNLLEQETRPGYDVSKPLLGIKPGEAAGAALSSAVLPGTPVSAGLTSLLKEGSKQAALGLASKALETGIDEGRLPTGKEAALSTIIPALGGVLGQKITEASPAAEKALAAANAAKPIEQQSFEAGQKIGLKAANAEGKAPAVMANLLSKKNQPKINEASATDLGLPKDTEITPDVLKTIRKDEGAPYGEIESLASAAKAKADQIRKERFTATDPHELAVQMNDPKTVAELGPLDIQAAADVDGLRKARKEASDGFFSYKRSGDPKALESAQAALERSHKLEDQIDQAAQVAGKPDLVDRLAASRQRIAKTYDYEQALNSSNADISAPVLGRLLDKGRPLSGNAKAIADFNNAFPYATKEGASVMAPGVTRAEGMTALLSMLSGIGAGTATGHTALGALAGAAPLFGPLKRQIVTSDAYQKIFQKYSPTEVAIPRDLKSMALQEAAQAAGQQK